MRDHLVRIIIEVQTSRFFAAPKEALCGQIDYGSLSVHRIPRYINQTFRGDLRDGVTQGNKIDMAICTDCWLNQDMRKLVFGRLP